MKKIVLGLFFSLLFLNASVAQTESEQKEAYDYTLKAIKLMDEGQYDESIKLLKKAKKIDPKTIIYNYEIAYAHYLQKDYKTAIKILEKYANHEDATDQYFQLIGNSYDILGKSKKAIKTYEEGIERFPESAKLYMEYGVLEYMREDYDKALQLWEKGITVDPTYSSSYYKLSTLFSMTEERIWSIFYGEVFVLLESGSKRTEIISALLYEEYDEAIEFGLDSAAVHFSKQMTIEVDPNNIESSLKIPFQMTHGMVMALSVALSGEKELSINALYNTRKNFLKNWYEQKRNEEYPNILIDYWKKVEEAGHLEAYNYWLFSMGNEAEFEAWYQESESKFEEFADWFNENQIPIDKDNYFIR